MNRRTLLTGLGIVGLGAPGLMRGVGSALAQETTSTAKEYGAHAEQFPWGGPVLSMHFHSRATPEADFLHLDGSGVTVAVLLTRTPEQDVSRQSMQAALQPNSLAVANEAVGKYLGRFYLFTSLDVMRPDAIETLRKTGFAGTRGFGELSGINVAIDGPEMRRVYELAAEMQIPVLTHYQDYGYGGGYTGSEVIKGTAIHRPQFPRLEAMLKAYPKTTFIGHGPAFWANISADVPPTNYPYGPVKQGGLSDKWLSDYPNLYGGLDATSGINALHRDPEFAKGFLVRHQDKLLFGSDCSCIDGRGAGRNSGGNGNFAGEPSLKPLVVGNCLARVNLTQLKQLASPDIFRKITWENGTRLLKLPV